jgi:hypothetical protein
VGSELFGLSVGNRFRLPLSKLGAKQPAALVPEFFRHKPAAALRCKKLIATLLERPSQFSEACLELECITDADDRELKQ